MILSYKNDSTLSLNPLTMKLNGIVDAAVMGGVSNYETVRILWKIEKKNRFLSAENNYTNRCSFDYRHSSIQII